jgi:hypothetical protein
MTRIPMEQRRAEGLVRFANVRMVESRIHYKDVSLGSYMLINGGMRVALVRHLGLRAGSSATNGAERGAGLFNLAFRIHHHSPTTPS